MYKCFTIKASQDIRFISSLFSTSVAIFWRRETMLDTKTNKMNAKEELTLINFFISSSKNLPVQSKQISLVGNDSVSDCFFHKPEYLFSLHDKSKF